MISLGRPRNGILRSQVPRLWADSRQPFLNPITEELPVIRAKSHCQSPF
jgi:hypothetical protein